MNRTTYKIVVSGLLIAISIVLTRLFSFTFPVLNFPASRLSIGFLPIMLAGILLGPVWGVSVGALADVIGFFLSNSQQAPYSPLITIVSALVGLVSFVIYRIFAKAPKALRISLSVTFTMVVLLLFCNTYVLSALYGIPYWAMFLGRLPVLIIMIPVYCLLLYYILRGLEKAKLLPPQPSGHLKG